jgi:probable F420-dependent oxidoreductase
VPRAFRFIATMPRLESAERWRDDVRRIEAQGFGTVAVSDHLTQGWVMEPLAALAAAAEATERLRLLSLVLSNDFRHPVLVHKAAATIDVLSGGRLELGLGAGWLKDDYEAAGLRLDPASTRIDRLRESVQVIKSLFEPEPATYTGQHYRLRDLDGLPKPLQVPRPPILLGGGGRRMLELAAEEADIVGVHCNLQRGRLDGEAAADLRAERIDEKVAWVRASAAAADRDVELQFTVYLCRITDAKRSANASISSFARLLAADPDLVASSPAVLVGSVDACAEHLQERRERYGFSYVTLGGDVDNVAPLVARLSGS